MTYFTDDKIFKMKAMGMHDSKVYFKLFSPGVFSRPWSVQQEIMIEYLDARDNLGGFKHQFINLISGRGIGKSTIGEGMLEKRVDYREAHMCPIISKSGDYATTRSENIKRKMLQNELKQRAFGEIELKKIEGSEIRKEFTKDGWMVYDSFVIPLGILQEVRGMNIAISGSVYRPDFILVTDHQTKKHLENEDMREEDYAYITTDVMRAFPLPDTYEKNTCQMLYENTLKHVDAVSNRLIDDSHLVVYYDEDEKRFVERGNNPNGEWVSLVLPLCDNYGNTLAPNYIQTDTLRKIKENHRRQGKIHLFNMEFRCRVFDESKLRAEDHFYYYDWDDPSYKHVFRTNNSIRVVMLDPSKTSNPTSDFSAFSVFNIHPQYGIVDIVDVFSDRFEEHEIYETAFELAITYDCQYIFYEQTGINMYINNAFKSEKTIRGWEGKLQPIEASTAGITKHYSGRGSLKKNRFREFLRLYIRNFIRHNSQTAFKYEKIIKMFPSLKSWDVADTLSYLLVILDKLGIVLETVIPANEIEKQMQFLVVQENRRQMDNLASFNTPSVAYDAGI